MTESALDSNLSAADKIYGLSLLWREVIYNFAFFDQVPDLDWEKAYREYLPRVLATDSIYHYYRELQRFCALLKDGHTNVYFPPDIQKFIWYPPIAIKSIQRQAIVIGVGKELSSLCPSGSEIIAVDGIPTSEYLSSEVFPYISSSTEHILWDWGMRDMLAGVIGTEVRFTIRTPENQTRELTLMRQKATNGIEWLIDRSKSAEVVEFEWLSDGLAYVAINNFANDAVVEAFENILQDLYVSRGVIIDLRRNIGGNSDYAIEVVKHLTDKPFLTSKWRTRQHIATYKAWGQWADEDPDFMQFRTYYEGNAWYEEGPEKITPPKGPKVSSPLVVLIGHNTASAAEDFLICLDSVKRGTLVGQKTFGSTGQPLFIDLPGGGQARICTKRDTFPDGREFVGYGIQPDVPVEPSAEDILTGRDIVLEKGIETIKSMTG
jgi:C-terminal processing protease CtpA/Prc